MRIIPASDSSVLASFGNSMSQEIQQRVLTLFRALMARRDPRIRNLHPGYSSLVIDLDPLAATHEEIAGLVEVLLAADSFAAETPAAVIEIPVCYDSEFGPDQVDVAAHTGLPIEEVVRLHSGANYRVCFLGFTAGFAFLGGMPEALHTPRLPTPRRTVAAGSVGIAGSQTGIYPTQTPGGWRLIGRTPVRMFDVHAQPPTRLQAGDEVRFSVIGRAEFERLRQAEKQR
jgi:inhibitor of KinA